MKRALTEYDIAVILALASKVCSVKLVVESGDPKIAKQLHLLKDAVSKVLIRLDKQVPSIIPTPTDGIPWSQR